MQEFDMEVTDERLSYMKNLLAMLYADQIGAEVKSINVRPVGGGAEREPIAASIVYNNKKSRKVGH